VGTVLVLTISLKASINKALSFSKFAMRSTLSTRPLTAAGQKEDSRSQEDWMDILFVSLSLAIAVHADCIVFNAPSATVTSRAF
jgi:hypothetical protein